MWGKNSGALLRYFRRVPEPIVILAIFADAEPTGGYIEQIQALCEEQGRECYVYQFSQRLALDIDMQREGEHVELVDGSAW